MTPRKSRWTDPAIIVAALAVANGGYWQYRAIGRADDAALATAQAALLKQINDAGSIIIRHDERLNDHDRRLGDLERRR